MRVFLTGASGWVGSAVLRNLREAGHSVTGLVRSREGAERLVVSGATPVLGSLGDLDVLRSGAAAADAVIHTAFGLDFSNYAKLSEEDRCAIEAFGEALAGTSKPLVVTSGLGLLPRNETLTEASRPDAIPDYPRVTEQTAFALAERGVRASVVRLARSVYGAGEHHGFVPQLAAIARAKGCSAYLEGAEVPWPAVHRKDAAQLFRLVAEQGPMDQAFHGVAEQVPFAAMAEVIGRQVGVPVRAMDLEEARSHFGGLATWVTGGGGVSSARTREALGWEPGEAGFLETIDRPDYCEWSAR